MQQQKKRAKPFQEDGLGNEDHAAAKAPLEDIFGKTEIGMIPDIAETSMSKAKKPRVAQQILDNKAVRISAWSTP